MSLCFDLSNGMIHDSAGGDVWKLGNFKIMKIQ